MALFDTHPAGLLSPEIESQIKNQQLMALGLGLLQGSGPSTTPTSFGQIIGQAGLGAMETGQSLTDRAISRALEARRMVKAENEPARTYEIGGSIVQQQSDGTFKPVYTAPQQMPDAPKGFQWGFDDAGKPSLTPIPGGPADPGTKPLPADATLKLSNYQNALNDAKAFEKIAIQRDAQGKVIGFNDTDANLPEARRMIFSAVASKLRADSGATVTTDDVENELKKYGWSFFSSDKTNAQAVDRLLRDIENGVTNITSGGRSGTENVTTDSDGWSIEEQN